MNPLQMLADQPGVPRLGSTLLHFLWQGVAIAAVYALARRRARTSTPNVRYLLGCVAMAAMAVAPLVTWWAVGPSTAGVTVSSQAARFSGAASGAARGMATVFRADGSAAPAPLLSWVVAIWLLGATALWIRLIGGWTLAARLRTRLVKPAPAAWQQTLDRLRIRMRISTPVRLLLSPLVPTPAVVGWLRPVVLAPVAALTGLPAEQMEALLLHELAHIRRHDYLVNMLQSAVEALLFYHPAVWWISGHLRDERELGCDDAVVSASGDSIVYARALAGLSTLCPPVVMAASGGSLSHRIARLLGQPRSTPRTLSGPGIVATAVLPLMVALALIAQPAPRPKFEVASIKLATDRGPLLWMVRPLPNGLTGTAPLNQLIQLAYEVQGFQIAGGPDWSSSDRYSIVAKGAGTPSRAQIKLMLQSLLEDRFQLKIRRETRELPVFDLVIAKGGPKLPSPKEGGCDDSADSQPEPSGGRMTPPGSGALPPARCGGLNVMLETGGARMYGGRIPMPELIRTLSLLLGRIVVDKTGFTGLFDVSVGFLPDGGTPLLPPPPPEAASSSAMSPSIFSALPQQLGLRLESTKGPVEVIVIEHVERPSAN